MVSGLTPTYWSRAASEEWPLIFMTTWLDSTLEFAHMVMRV